MTPHRKANHDSHSCFSPVMLGRTAARRLRDDHRLNDGSSSRGIVTDFCRQNDGVGRRLFRNETAPRRCGGVLQIQSRVLWRGGVAWEQFRISDGADQARTSEQLFIPGAKIFRGSVSLCGRSGLMIRLRALRSVRNARSATRVFSSTASASRTPKRCTRSTARYSATNFSSGDGLGIHQPGSMTRGTRAKVKTPSGRARDRAMCPAVARSIEGRAA